MKSAEAVRNMAAICKNHSNQPLVVIVSAMDKTTNHLEQVFDLAFNSKPYQKELDKIFNFHETIALELLNDEKLVAELLDPIITSLNEKLEFSERYDQVISYGEIFSTKIIHAYLEKSGQNFEWIDSRQKIRTNDRYRDASVNWDITQLNISELTDRVTSRHIITQGFIGGTAEGLTTTLGREGSDFTGAIYATCLKAESLTVWKDVPGILNADPKIIPTAIKFDEISYEEAAEMTYYGAKVIHPKTIKPLANAKIPLYVRPFLTPDEVGTAIDDVHTPKKLPSIIFKEDQTLISFKVEDFTFINERNISEILHALTEQNIRINLMQNSAISFSVCVDSNQSKVDYLISALSDQFSVFYNSDLTLITIKNYDQPTIDECSIDKEILLEQRSRHNFQIVVR